MAYSAEIIKNARARLAQDKADRESKHLQEQAIAYQKVPRLKEIDMLLRQSMVAAAQTAFAQGIDVRAVMEQTKEENLKLQKERDDLLSANFTPDFLDERPICDKCGGEGYLGTAMCDCLREYCRQEQRRSLALLSGNEDSFADFNLEYYPEKADPKYGISPRAVMERNFKACRRYAAEFSAASGNLLFVGGTGLGKTFLSACIAREVSDKGFSVAYETASHLLTKLEQAKFNPTEEALRDAARLTECDLLIIDDLGTELPGQFTTAALYSLLNDRLLQGKSMVISTNLTIDELTKRYSPQIGSRLHGSFTMLAFLGNDIRVLKNKK